MNLNLLNYSNYYNREVKKFDTLAEYEPYVVGVTENINFNPGDGVDTTQIVNYDGEVSPNYVVIDDGVNVISRWFIIDADFVRRGQVKLHLHRDVIVDNYDSILNAPMYIERAQIDDNNPLIFNNEDVSFNQIKTKETLLQDKSKCPWIVGYVSPLQADGTPFGLTKDFKLYQGAPDIILDGGLDTWEYNSYIGGNYKAPDEHDIRVIAKKQSDNKNNSYNIYIGTNRQNSVGTTQDSGSYIDPTTTPAIQLLKKLDKEMKAQFDNPEGYQLMHDALNAEFPGFTIVDQELRTKLLSLNGQVIQYQDENGNKKYKRISCGSINRVHNQNIKVANHPTLAAKFNTAVHNVGFTGDISSTCWDGIKIDSNTFTFKYLDVAEGEYSINTTFPILQDAPYSMFCMPYKDTLFKNLGPQRVDFTMGKNLSINMATTIATLLGDACYDLQMLPYCPVPELLDADGNIDFNNEVRAVAAEIHPKGSYQPVALMIFAKKSSFTFDIDLPEPIVVKNPKVENECDMYRLCSPNFNGIYEFSAAKNGGLTGFNVDATYLPFNPYIHLNPKFGGLYGKDFDDARGLICGGNYSLARLDSRWVNYELNNKNYSSIFDREINTLNLQNEKAHIMDIVKASTGIVTGAAGGAMAGSMMGGGSIGAGIFGILGAAGAATAGHFDIAINKELREDALQLKKDIHGYQLGNIKAIPQSLAKTTAYTLNNKYFPVLEYYTCTPEEKETFANYIKYYGMKLNVIGKISDYKKAEPSYIQGTLIKNKEINDDFHMLTSIAEELHQGIYI